MEDSINIYIKSFKFQKITKFCTFVWYKSLCSANITILVTMWSITQQVFIRSKHKIEFLLINI